MYYVEDQDPILVKQEVHLDEARLKGLCQEIVARFGGYVHRSYDGLYGPYSFQMRLEEGVPYVKNYVETPLEGEMSGTGKMHYEYDEYVIPELARWIRALLEGDASALDAIRKGKEAGDESTRSAEKAKELREAKQRRAMQDMKEYLEQTHDSLDGERFRQLSDRVMASLQEEPDQENQAEMKEYYKKAAACITYRSVKTLYKDKWNELRRVYTDVKEFYEGTGMFEELMGKLDQGTRQFGR